MPDWIADPVDEAHAARWPLRLLTAPGYYQSHTAFSGNSTLRRRAGAPECVLHPADARKRGLTNGDDVALVNDLGEVRMRLRVSDEVGPGVVLVPGQRPSGESGGTTINMLCSTRYADLGEGATYQSTCLDARRV
jgi:anaerobic selenocysteine-containing dehydrogenase